MRQLFESSERFPDRGEMSREVHRGGCSFRERRLIFNDRFRRLRKAGASDDEREKVSQRHRLVFYEGEGDRPLACSFLY